MIGFAAVVTLAACSSGPRAATGPSTTAPAATVAPPVGRAPAAPTTRPPVTVGVKVWFLDQNRAATGEEPLYQPVDRRVQPPAVAAGALDALFAGPSPAEEAGGLRLITSGATGYQKLHIDNGVAHVTLSGGCSSGGSTMTIAGEIMPTLRQFASVSYVKIYAPDGTTENPAGAVDSIPFCLEP